MFNMLKSQQLNKGLTVLTDSPSSIIQDDVSPIEDYFSKVKASLRIVFFKDGPTQIKIELANFKLLINAYVIFSILNFLKLDDIELKAS